MVLKEEAFGLETWTSDSAFQAHSCSNLLRACLTRAAYSSGSWRVSWIIWDTAPAKEPTMRRCSTFLPNGRSAAGSSRRIDRAVYLFFASRVARVTAPAASTRRRQP